MTSRPQILHELRTLLAYGLVGLFNTGFTAGIMAVSARCSVPYPIYTTYAYIAGMLASFLLNRSFTFQSGKPLHAGRTLVKFIGANLGLLGLVHLVQYLLIERVGLRELVGVAIGMICYTGLGYLLNRIWVFQNPPGETPHAAH
jgi:putative flippase GtrA